MFVGRYSNTPWVGFVMGFYRIWRFVHFVGCVQDFWKAGTGSCTLWNQYMRPPSHSRPHPPLAVPTIWSHFSSRAKAMHLASPILPYYNCYGLRTKLVNATFLSRISFVIIVGKKDIMKLFILPSFRNGSNSDYHGKICQHLPLPLNQKPKHFSLPLRLSPPRVIPIKMLRRKSTMLTRGRCFKPMLLTFKLCKMNLNHWGPNLLI